MVDLHTHSTFSDGSHTPEELAGMAKRAGLYALALTDHDTTAGLERFTAACAEQGIKGIPGVEISADVSRGTMHILGYYVSADYPGLCVALERIREGRSDRNGKILEKLASLGMSVSMDEVSRYAGDEVVGRPHVARAMVEKGYVRSCEEAFDKYLAKGRPAYVDRFRLSSSDSVRIIRDAGGVAVLAHPFTLELDNGGLRRIVAELREFGLQGIEAYYSEHSQDQTRRYVALAREMGLLTTGGSDFHGGINPAVKLGIGFGNLCVPDRVADDLLAAAGMGFKPARQTGA